MRVSDVEFHIAKEPLGGKVFTGSAALGQSTLPVSTTSFPIDMMCCGTNIGSATAFFYNFNGSVYIITNWHVATGRKPAHGYPIDPDARVPDEIIAHIYGEPLNNSQLFTGVEKFALHLDLHLPITEWVMHPKGQNYDIAALKFTDPGLFRVQSVNQFTYDKPIMVADEVYILGFPKNLRPTGFFPIWKRGSIATEPFLLPNGEPWLLVDAATREGMSGSPVLVKSATGLVFGGVYAGREGVADALEAQLGKVWLPEAIIEVLTSQTPLSHVLADR